MKMGHTSPLIDPEREALRLAKLDCFDLLDTAEEREFNALVAMARRTLGCPVALVSLIDGHRQWFKAKCGLDMTETPREHSFCAHTIISDDLLVIEDATLDPRFRDNPFVTGDFGIRFYAGAPLRPKLAGFPDEMPAIGALCVIDTKPRSFSDEDAEVLRNLANVVSGLIGARAAAGAALRHSIEAQAQAAATHRKQRQLAHAARIAGIGYWRVDLATQTAEWSDQVFVIHGLERGEMPSVEKAVSFYPVEERARVNGLLEAAVQRGEPFEFESDFVRADGELRRVRSMGEIERDGDGAAVAVIGVFQDVTEHYLREQSLRETALTDTLTRLPNRASFEAHLDEAMAHARDAAEPLALLLLDLDGFKAVNDTFGHAAGDEVLREIAGRLQQQGAYSARLGGDEFVMLLSRPRDCAELPAFLQSLLGELRHSVSRSGETRSVSATIGAALLEPGAMSAGELLRRADLALYAAKRFERGTGQIFGRADLITHARSLRQAYPKLSTAA